MGGRGGPHTGLSVIMKECNMVINKKVKRRTRPIVVGYLERVSALIFDKFQKEITEMIRGHQGIYALYRRNKLYYVGLASNLKNRIKYHLKDRHQGKWTHFSLYIIRKADHIKELESMLLRIAHPEGNKQRGKLRTSNNLLPVLKRQVKRKVKEELDSLFKGYRVPQKNKTRKSAVASGAKKEKPLKGYFSKPTRIYACYKGKNYKGLIYKTGTVKFAGQLYESPSGAGKAVKGGKATNGCV